MKSGLKIGNRSKPSIQKYFQLGKYDACKDWGAEEWYKAISYRVNLKKRWNRWNESIRKNDHVDGVEQEYNLFKYSAERLIEDPLYCADNLDSSRPVRHVYDQSVADLFGDARDDRLISSSWGEDYLKWNSIPIHVRYALEKNLHEGLVNKIEKTPTWFMKREEWGETEMATIHVHVNGDDAEIVNEFREWLRRTKEEMRVVKKVTNIDEEKFSKWCDDRVLPCFDLCHYEDVFKNKTPLRDLTEALFPVSMSLEDEIKNEDQVKRTIIPNSLKIVSAGVAASLARMLKK